MSSQSLLNKERDFLELNKELEDKVKSLMVEVDTIISRQENVMRSPRRSRILSRKNKTTLREPQLVTESDEEESKSNDGFFEKSLLNENLEEM